MEHENFVHHAFDATDRMVGPDERLEVDQADQGGLLKGSASHAIPDAASSFESPGKIAGVPGLFQQPAIIKIRSKPGVATQIFRLLLGNKAEGAFRSG